MTKRQLIQRAAAIAVMAIGTFAAAAQSPTAKSTDEAAIRQIVHTMESGWNSHDGVMFSSPFAADADYVIVNGDHVSGKPAIEEGHTALFTGIYKESRNKANVKSIRFIRPDVAIAH
ncbi:MAG: SgcJ/EcaC family oxidoreductase, partial [Pyrinomonadaceae bacterium]